MMIYNFHEGADVSLRSIEKISENEIKIDKVDFVKIAPYLNQDFHSNPNIFEAIIFNGKYKNSNNEIVSFNKDGTVSGLGDFKYYFVQLDYIDAGLDVDLMILGKEVSDINIPPAQYSKWFGFNFKNGYLNIYKIKCEEYYQSDCVKMADSDLVYRLKRLNGQ